MNCKGSCLQLLGLWNFFVFFRFFPLNFVYFWIKSRKKLYGCFFHSICANFGNKNIGRTKLTTLKMLIFANFWGPEVVGSSSYQKNIWAKFTHLYIPLLCKEFFWCATTLDTLIFTTQGQQYILYTYIRTLDTLFKRWYIRFLPIWSGQKSSVQWPAVHVVHEPV